MKEHLHSKIVILTVCKALYPTSCHLYLHSKIVILTGINNDPLDYWRGEFTF